MELKKLLIKNEVVCLYRNKKHTENFFVGIVNMVDDDNIVFASLSREGEIDGLTLINNKDVYLIEKNNNYIEQMKKTLRNKDVTVFKEDNKDVKKVFFEHLSQNENIVEVEVNNSAHIDVRGRIVNYDDQWLEIQVIKENQDNDGIAFCRIEDITVVNALV